MSLMLLLALSSAPQLTSAASLEASGYESAEGYFQLFWEADEPVVLIEASKPDFSDGESLYVGRDSAHVISGKPNGTWHYRLEAADDRHPLAESITVTVRHHPLSRAFAFFTVGAVVFASTLALIAAGGRQ